RLPLGAKRAAAAIALNPVIEGMEVLPRLVVLTAAGRVEDTVTAVLMRVNLGGRPAPTTRQESLIPRACLRHRLPTRQLSSSRLKRRRAVLPLIVGELLHVRAVIAHDEQLAVRLRRVGVGRLVLEAEPRCDERDL